MEVNNELSPGEEQIEGLFEPGADIESTNPSGVRLGGSIKS